MAQENISSYSQASAADRVTTSDRSDLEVSATGRSTFPCGLRPASGRLCASSR